MQDLYLNTNPIIIRKWKTKIKTGLMMNIDMEANKDKYDGEIIINFPSKFIEGTSKANSANLFKKTNSNKYVEDISIKDNVYTVKHMNLLPYTTISELKYIICSVLKMDINDILSVNCTDDLNTIDPLDKDKIKNFIWFHTIEHKPIDYEAYEKTTSIGYKSFIVDVLWKNVKLNVNYDYEFYDNYCTIRNYISNLIKDYDEMVKKGFAPITKDIIVNNNDIQNIEVSLIYGKSNDRHETLINEINIVKLFNITHTSTNLKKILINDSMLTEYNNEDRETQYIKTPTDIDEPFKNTFSRFNCCSIYVVNEIYPGLTLSRIEFYKNGLIKCCFMVNDPDISIKVANECFQNYFKRDETTRGRFWKLIDKLHLEECVYDFYFDINNYIPVYSNISYIFNLDNVKASKFKDSFKIVDQRVPSMVYKTNTSTFFNLYSTFDLNVYYSYYYSRSFHNVATETTIKNDVLTHGHLQASDQYNIVCYLSKCFTESDLIMNAILLLPIFGINKKTAFNKEDYDKLTDEQKEKIIRNKYKSVPTKKAIKKLMEIDPVLFGTRIIENDVRPYSALAQKREQRVVAVNKEEYNTLFSINPEYVSDIRNQSQGNQRLYLFCPFDEFKFLNYHHYHNQLCIPKCTTGITKRTQYMYCNNQLDARNAKDTFTGDSSKMIVYYSPLLLAGRKCFPPEELSIICENYLLYRQEFNIDILEHCKTKYDLLPFIITRDNINKQYILNTEIENNQEYMLVLQSELDNGYYTILDENQKPYKLSEHNEILQFFKSIQTNKNMGYILFNFIDDVFKLNISEEYKNKTFRNILNLLHDTYKIDIVTNVAKTDIIAVVNTDKNTYLFVPSLKYDKTSLNIDTLNINLVISNYNPPTIDMFDKKFIKCYYQDYKTKKICAIDYYGVNNIIEPIDEDTINIEYDKPVILFDFEAYYNYYLFGASKKVKENNFVTVQQNKTIESLLCLFIFILYNSIPNIENVNLKEKLKDVLNQAGIIKEKTNIVKLIDKSNSISWRKTTISEEDFDNIFDNNFANINYLTLIDIVYNELYYSMNIFDTLNGKISSKIITNNTI